MEIVLCNDEVLQPYAKITQHIRKEIDFHTKLTNGWNAKFNTRFTLTTTQDLSSESLLHLISFA